MSMPRILERSHVIRSEAGEAIGCDVRRAPSAPPAPAVVLCHSFMAFKEWGFFPHAGRRIAEGGFTSVAFNFSHNGVVLGGERITAFDRFSSNSFTREIAELGRVVRAVRQGEFGGEEDGLDGRVVVIGHSRGGGVAASYASRDPDLAAIVTWSAVSTFDRWSARQKEEWRRRGFLPLSGGPEPGPLRLGRQALEEIETLLPEIDPVVRAPYITAPWLILHGRADVTVPAGEAEALARAAAGGTATLMLLDSVGHLYNARTPGEDHYVTLNHVIAVTLEWIRGAIS